MGRFYDGDINGKFWFGVQASDAANRFGVNYTDPGYIDYYFPESALGAVKKELSMIAHTLGNNMQKLDEFFAANPTYSDDTLEKAGLLEIWDEHKVDYVDYGLGCQIRDCIKEYGDCSFTAEY